jgi:hypothetical protein
VASQGKAYDFQAYAAGNKVYGLGRSSPTNGPVDKLGYRERDAKTRLKRNAMLRRMKAGQKGHYMDKNYLGGRGV